MVRGRFAPSPTGAMHLGNARTALLAWLDARARGGAFVMRIEDLDRARIVEGAEARLLDDLRWLGLDWDEGPDIDIGAGAETEAGGPYGPYRQSQRVARYDAAIASLLAEGRAFPCACSRADVARAASAPHAGDDEGPRYPGTCRGLAAVEVEARAAQHGRRPAIRFDGRANTAAAGGAAGSGAAIDDFVLRRADGVAAYQLAVVVDDIAMAITRVVRGDDLLPSTPRQLALYRAFGVVPPLFAHVPLLLAPGGERLAKRTRPTSLADLRRRGVQPRRVVGALAASVDLCAPDANLAPRDLVAGFDLARVPAQPSTEPAI